MIQAVIERCAGIDVGKTFIVVCVMTGEAQAEPAVEVRRFGTFNQELEDLRLWLISEGCTHVVMESTGSYWKPIFNILEESIEVILANARDVKGRKGHKTDWKDSRWLAHLLRHGMIRPSFIPERGIRELRGLTRRRKQLTYEATGVKNRISKVLEEANVKLGSVLSDIFGVSGRAILLALMEGKMSAAIQSLGDSIPTEAATDAEQLVDEAPKAAASPAPEPKPTRVKSASKVVSEQERTTPANEEVHPEDAEENVEANVGVQAPDVAPEEAKATKRVIRQKKTPTGEQSPKAPREESKTSRVIDMLKSEGGITLEEIMTTMGWQKHTTRAMLSAGGSLTKKHGLVVTSEKVGEKRVYTIKA